MFFVKVFLMPQTSATAIAATANQKQLNRVPLATYRLQLNSRFNLDDVASLQPYLGQLGITDLYLSPLFRAREESSHGYDVVDHGTIDPAIGDFEKFREVAQAAREAGMGILLDVVPNHMGINDPGNKWWLDVLENGEGSYFAGFFDIDWHPAAVALDEKVLLPFLGEPFGRVLENGDLQVIYEEERLQLSYGTRRYPLAPRTWTDLLDLAHELGVATVSTDASDWIELQSIVTQLRNLPAADRRDPAAMEERYREQRIARRRLAALLESSSAVKAGLDNAIRQLNGEKGNGRSFDQLEKLLDRQSYRLAFWRVAADEINYRRFFDINELAAIRVEEPRVFDAVHRLVGRFLMEGWVTGLRIDHPDGLRDPQSYFRALQGLYRSQQLPSEDAGQELYVVAEKILSGEEPLHTDWSISGTTGYDFLNLLGRLQVSEEGLADLRKFYVDLCDWEEKPADIVYRSKRDVLLQSMSSELQMLTAQLYRIAQQHRAARDFTRPSLQRALREVIACMTVYRSYVRQDSWDVSESDYRIVSTAVRMAKRRNRTMAMSVFDFIASVLLLEHPPTLTDEQAAEWRQFALKLQQVSGPVAAKGVEDTAFYRYYPLASLNEVGGELDARPLSIDEFHRLMRQRMAEWPHSLSATATHDSKRGEDVRARLHVLSEVPGDWSAAYQRWRKMNRRFEREVDGDPVPDRNEQYLLYQTFVGTWPTGTFPPAERGQYANRIVQYMEKALREAKIHTSWMNPAEMYESAVFDFVRDLLGDDAAEFQGDLGEFVGRIADSGYINSLAQVLLKITLPGVPDFYQGSELWDFNLVDPDNRRPVDFDDRRHRLNRLLDGANRNVEKTAGELSARWPDPDVKLWVITRALTLRNHRPDVFSHGEYIPLATIGEAAEHVVSFARRWEGDWIIAVVPRHHQRLAQGQSNFTGSAPCPNWRGTQLVLPEGGRDAWRCEISGRSFRPRSSGDQMMLDIGQVLSVFPVALLTLQAN
jgi:(1->4)-alpha-D-glucan 1-alpha-D-glucosylmutase